MQPRCFIVPVVLLFAGCQSSQVARLGTDALAIGAGGLMADKASGGNPYWTLTGGVAALGTTEWARSAMNADQQKQLALAYERGKAQGAQAAYDAIQRAQRESQTAPEKADDYIEIPITAPERTINGVKINASTEFIRISNR